MERVGELAATSAGEMAISDAQSRGMKGRLAILVKHASGLTDVAEELEATSAEYVNAMEDVSAGNVALIERLEEDPSQLDEGREWALMIRGLSATSREMLASLSGLVDSLKENAKLSQVLRQPTNRIVKAFDAIKSATAAADEWDRRLQALGVPAPPPGGPAQDEKPADESLPPKRKTGARSRLPGLAI
jgi:hypothetical protein